jgi:hypothetical protein
MGLIVDNQRHFSLILKKFVSLQIGLYLKPEEFFKNQRIMSLIIHNQPHKDLGEVRTEGKRLVCPPPFVHVTSNRFIFKS